MYSSLKVRCITLSPVYTIQPVVKAVVKPVWQPVKCLYTRYNRLSPVWQPAVSCKRSFIVPFIFRPYEIFRTHEYFNGPSFSYCSTTYVIIRNGTGIHRFIALWPLRSEISHDTAFTRYNRLSIRLSNGFDNRLNVCIHDTSEVKWVGFNVPLNTL